MWVRRGTSFDGRSVHFLLSSLSFRSPPRLPLDYIAELGINPSHILSKSLTVLNPLSKPDEQIMDDADLAGPLLFCFGFAMVLLFVSFSKHPSFLSRDAEP